MTPQIAELSRRIDVVMPQLSNDLARIMLEVHTHHRHNAKVDVLAAVLNELELVARTIHELADMNRLHEASSIGRPVTSVTSKPSVAHPSGSGEEGTSS